MRERHEQPAGEPGGGVPGAEIARTQPSRGDGAPQRAQRQGPGAEWESAAGRRSGRVLVAHDTHLLAQLIVAQLRVHGIAADQARPHSHQGILDAAAATAYDVVILSLDLDGQREGALPLIGPLRQTGARVVLLAGATDDGPPPQALEGAVSGWVDKTGGVAELLAAVHDAFTAGSSWRGGLRDALWPEPWHERRDDDRYPVSFERLTRRERQVLAALMDGRSARGIAAEWVVSYETVRTQIRSVLRKLGVATQLEAVVVAQRAGWPGPDERSSLSA